jgi:uncharacterized membrane protein YdjX (TVP38/TMEM64 family)
MQRGRVYKLAIGLLFPLFLAAAAILAWQTRAIWTPVLGSEVDAQEWIRGYGAWGPVVYIVVQIVQVVVFVIPGDVVQIAGGYLFGVLGGLGLSLVGILAGSCINFAVARALGRPFVEGVFGAERVRKFDVLLEAPRARTGFFLFFVIPGIPKDVLVYVAGISTLRFPVFVAVSMLGRIPGILGSAVIGNGAANENWWLSGGVFALAALLFGLGVLFRSRLQDLVERFARGRVQRSEAAPPNEDPNT